MVPCSPLTQARLDTMHGSLFSLAFFVSFLCSSVQAWGVVGHQVVATIAQIHLHESTRKAVARLVPEYANGHLAPIAAWADRVSPSSGIRKQFARGGPCGALLQVE